MRRTIDVDFYPNRNVQTQHIMENNKLIEIIIYHENGVMRNTIPYVDGCIHGIEKFFDGKGELSMTIEWVNSELHGYCYAYENGQVEYVKHYRYNSLIDEW